jgi:hypothetical protein
MEAEVRWILAHGHSCLSGRSCLGLFAMAHSQPLKITFLFIRTGGSWTHFNYSEPAVGWASILTPV